MTLIGIVDDNAGLVKSLSLLLEGSGRYQVVLRLTSGLQIVEEVKQKRPEIILLDIDMPGINGIEAVKLVKGSFPEVVVIMFTGFEDEDKIYQSLMAGASGYILKKSTPGKILEALDEIREGGAAMSPVIAQKLIEMFTGQRKSSKAEFNLSNRELEILQNLVKGYTNKDIGVALSISAGTVRSHLKNIYEKMHVNNKAEAVAVAMKARII